MAFAEELWGLLPGATLSGTKVTCGEDLAEVLVGALRRLRGGDPSSTSESSLAPPTNKEKDNMIRAVPQRKNRVDAVANIILTCGNPATQFVEPN